MMSFYQADALNRLRIPAKLFVSIDPPQWGTNVPGLAPWLLGGSSAGRYLVPSNIDHWINFTQPIYPGGGRAELPLGNKHTKFRRHARIAPHRVVRVTPR